LPKIKELMSIIFTKLIKSDSVINLKMIQKKNFPYVFIWIIYYAWVTVFTTWWTASPIMENVFGTELRNMLHSVNLISSAIFIFIIKKEWFVKSARIGSIFIVIGMCIFMTTRNNYLDLIAATLIGISLGAFNISILIPFVFALNNTEKFYAVVGTNILINIISFVQSSKYSNTIPKTGHMIVSFALLVLALSSILFFKREAVKCDDNIIKIKMPSRIYLTLVLNCIFAILCKGLGKGILNITVGITNIPVLLWYYIGGILGCIIYIAIFGFSKKSIHLAWNITFGSMTMGLLCNAFIDHVEMLGIVFAILIGIASTIGMINMYYMLGVIGKKYNSMKYIQLSILFIGICGGVAGILVGNCIYNINTFEMSITASIISVAVMLIFLMLSPIFTQIYYCDEWASDSEKNEIDNEHLYFFKKYCLSKREIEVCKLLLEGYTLRQISAIISIAYPTVNTYCTSIYRKLGINSRTELFIIFKDYPLKRGN